MPAPYINQVGTPATPQFAELVLQEYVVDANGNSSNFVNVIHLRNQTTGVVTTEANLLTAIRTILNAVLPSALSVASLGKTAKLRFMDSPVTGYVAGTAYSAGTVTGDRLPTFNSVVQQKKTGVRGRSYKGSIHWGPIAESQTTLDELNAGAITLWEAVEAAIWNGGAGFTVSGGTVWKLSVISILLSNLVSNPCVFTGADVNAMSTNKVIGTMRRRKEKGGVSV